MEALQLILGILSLLRVRDRAIIIAEPALVQRLDCLGYLMVVGPQLVYGMSQRGALGNRMKGIDRTDRLAWRRNLRIEHGSSQQFWLNIAGIAHDRLLQVGHSAHVLGIGIDPERLPIWQQPSKITALITAHQQLSRGVGALDLNFGGDNRQRQVATPLMSVTTTSARNAMPNR
jgi:hypothetical protein